MVVKLYSSIEDKETKSGQLLKEKFEKDAKLASPENQVHIITSVQCYGQQPRDIDVVVFGSLNDYIVNVECGIYNSEDNIIEREVKINNFCVVIEVKKHDPENLYFKGTHLIVDYANKIEHNATLQSQEQKYSLRNYLETNIWVSSLIFLPNVSKRHFENKDIADADILFSDFELSDFWYKLLQQRLPLNYKSQANYSATHPEKFESELEKSLEKLTIEIKRTPLDRKKIEFICKEKLDNQKYDRELGKQLLIFRGGGGTGKTISLLNLAWNIYDKYAKRVLILTFNNALVADIKRLLAIMKIPDGIDKSIQIKSSTKYWYEIFYKTKIRTRADIEKSHQSDYAAFSKDKKRLKDYFDSQEIKSQITDLRTKYPNLFSWDFIMIDEAQDWPDDERDLIYKLFGPNKIIIADGKGQLIREKSPCDWINHPLVNNKQVVPLKMSLRQKPNLTRFIKEIAEKLELPYDWDVVDNDKYFGGKVIIFEGDYSKEFHNRLIKQNKDGKNENIDMLFCVPPKFGITDTGNSKLADSLEEWGYSVWDGVREDVRRETYPTSIEQFRIVQYQSCRGLEGWICVNIAFDNFYELKLNSYETPKDGQLDFKSPEDRRKDSVSRWLFIPLTRAIDTLVLHIENPNSPISRILKEIHNNHPEYIEWISK